MSNLSNARAQLDAWEAKKPGDYTSQYKDKIDGVMGQLDGMKDFGYDPTRDAAYEQYKNSYTRQAKLANENAQANASAIYEAAEGHVLVGVLSKNYPDVASAVADMREYAKLIDNALSVGLGAGDPNQSAMVSEISRQVQPQHVNHG